MPRPMSRVWLEITWAVWLMSQSGMFRFCRGSCDGGSPQWNSGASQEVRSDDAAAVAAADADAHADADAAPKLSIYNSICTAALLLLSAHTALLYYSADFWSSRLPSTTPLSLHSISLLSSFSMSLPLAWPTSLWIGR
ncbi:hypothetical protein AJ79_05594 [Helicocarpus griseus UAMH5409]|uniref:Uncharacterized protein n=1 Tax=Helicocarpus griseus UAMH5409 TaxID=1447875 RepID=A0A2B7XMU0_9EURO|nr:hypothetical protein AJ79_05594 [Helicocarpus griseus UAMH5409]